MAKIDWSDLGKIGEYDWDNVGIVITFIRKGECEGAKFLLFETKTSYYDEKFKRIEYKVTSTNIISIPNG
jgi:hypothetical protein